MRRTFRHWFAAALLGVSASAIPFVLHAQENQAPPLQQGSTAAHEASEEAHESGPAPINWTQFGYREAGHHGEPGRPQPPFVATVINFLLLFAVLYFAVRRAVNPALQDRRAAMEAEIGEAQRLRSEAEAMHREYTERLAKMDDEFAKLRAEYIRLGEQEYQHIVEEAKSRAERMAREGEQVIQQEIRQLRSELLREAVDAAVTSAASTVQKQLTPSDQNRLADEYFAELEKTRGASA